MEKVKPEFQTSMENFYKVMGKIPEKFTHKHAMIECMDEKELLKVREGLKTPETIVFRESEQPPKSPEQPLKSPIESKPYKDTLKPDFSEVKELLTAIVEEQPCVKKKLNVEDSALWNKTFKKRELKKKIEDENETLFKFQQSLGGKEKPKEHLIYRFKTDELKVIPFGDWHYKADSCRVDKIQETIAYIKKSNAKVILMGDLMENATRYSVGAGVYEQKLSPMEQMNDICKMLEPIKKQILISLAGNHEWRTQKESGFNPAVILAEKLGVPYGGFKAFIEIHVNKYKYVIYATHGSTGARLPWTRMKAVDDVARHINADVILYGHTHDVWAHAILEEGIKNHKKLEVLTGGFLGDSPYGYVAMKNLPPMKTGVVKLKLFGDRWDVHASE